MKIAMIGHKRIPSREGGIEVVVEELSTRMVQRGYEVVCYNRSGHHVSGKKFDTEKLAEYKGVKLKSVLTINSRGIAAVTSSFFAAIRCAFSSCDVVHFHSEGICTWLWIPKLFGKRCVVTVHGLDHQREKWGFFASHYILFGEKIAAGMADEIIVLSMELKKYFMEHYKRETHYIPNGVNRPSLEAPSLIRRKFGLEKDEYLLFVGRLVSEKGLEYLLRAFRKVKTAKKLVIAGGPSDSDAFVQKLKEMGKKDRRVLFTGFVQGKLLDELYSNAYLYVLPSDVEGMPLTLLEAMSYGNCCLVSNIPECAEVVEDHALLFQKGSVEDLRKKLQILCDEAALVNRYKTAETSEFICRKCNWDRVVEQTLELYQ